MAGATARLEGQGHKSGLDPVTGAETRLQLKFALEMVTVKNGILYLEFFSWQVHFQPLKDKLIFDPLLYASPSFKQIFQWQHFSFDYQP